MNRQFYRVLQLHNPTINAGLIMDKSCSSFLTPTHLKYNIDTDDIHVPLQLGVGKRLLGL